MFFFILILFGLFAGLLSGMLGIGGGLIFAPVLYYLFDFNEVQNPELWTIGSSLFCTCVTALSGTLKHIQMNNIYNKESLRIGVFGILGTFIGNTIATSSYFSHREFVTLFSILLIYTGSTFIRKAAAGKVAAPAGDNNKKISWIQALKIGSGGGLVASLAGVGGGIILVPLMNLFYKTPFTKTVSISVYAIILISFSGAFQLALDTPATSGVSAFTLGFVDFGASFALVIGAFAGANLGAYLHDRVNLSYLQILFAILTFTVSGKMIYDALF
ncbi:MAG: sulfite exporter TauE/SafE family protein [Balneolales bacterium]